MTTWSSTGIEFSLETRMNAVFHVFDLEKYRQKYRQKEICRLRCALRTVQAAHSAGSVQWMWGRPAALTGSTPRRSRGSTCIDHCLAVQEDAADDVDLDPFVLGISSR